MPLSAVCLLNITVDLPYERGLVSYSAYADLPGTKLDLLTNAAVFPSDPSWVTKLTTFEAPRNNNENSGSVMRGYLLPPFSGFYTFWIASRGDSELWLGATTNSDSIIRIANVGESGDWPEPREWTKYASQQSQPLWLNLGEAYYIEARSQAGTGSNHLAIAWECATQGIIQDVIPGNFLSPADINYRPHVYGFHKYLHADAFPGTPLGIPEIDDFNIADREGLTIISGNDAGLFGFDPLTHMLTLAKTPPSQVAGTTNYVLQMLVTDNGQPPLSSTGLVAFDIVSTNAITTSELQKEIWSDIGPGTAIEDLTNEMRFPKRPDDLQPMGAGFGGYIRLAANCGARVRGLLTPTQTGDYTFFIASGGTSQLSLASTADGSNAVVIASSGSSAYQEWTKYPSQQSAPIALAGGHHYYLEGLEKVGETIGEHLEVAWSGPGISGRQVIDGVFLTTG